MPHLSLQISSGAASAAELDALCATLHGVLADSGIFPLGGIRVRVLVVDAFAVADQHPEAMFADAVLRIGAGRSEVDKITLGKALMEVLERQFSASLAAGQCALSLEILEIDPVFNWKTNSLHRRLAGATPSN